MIGFGWGDSEDLAMGPLDKSQGPIAHLPRAAEAISDKQLTLLKHKMEYHPLKNLIIASHFTFVSYTEGVSEVSNEEGNIHCSLGDYNQYCMGTFENSRKKIYLDHLSKNKCDINCVISGHSHRRGAYEITGNSLLMSNTAVTRMHTFEEYNGFQPVIVVTDSAGPIPRRNILGEFNAWGSDSASGTRVIFDKGSGKIKSIDRLSSKIKTAKPRIAVAIDYFDIIGTFYDIANKVYANFSEKALDDIKSDKFEEKRLINNEFSHVNFTIELNKNLIEWGVRIKEVWLSFFADKHWNHILLSKTYKDTTWSVDGKDAKIIYGIRNENKLHKYLSIFFDKTKGDHLSSYNFDDCWNIEVDLKFNKSLLSNDGSLAIERNLKLREDPNIKDRMKSYPKYK